MQCPRCQSEDVVKAGKQKGKQKYWCNGCQRHFQESYEREKPNYTSGSRDRYWRDKN